MRIAPSLFLLLSFTTDSLKVKNLEMKIFFCALIYHKHQWLPHLYVDSSVQFSHSVVSDSVTPWTEARQAFLSITNSWSLVKLKSIESVMPSNRLILCHSLLLPPSIFLIIRVFSNESILCIMRPKYWSFSFSISPSNEYSGLISFRIDWSDLLAVQETVKSLQHHNLKASNLLYGPTLTSLHD